MKKRISLYQRHIDSGCQRSSENCPVARAVIDSLKIVGSFSGRKSKELDYDWSVSITQSHAVITRSDFTKYYCAKIPAQVVKNIKSFDDNGIMVPMEFDLDFELVTLQDAEPQSAQLTAL